MVGVIRYLSSMESHVCLFSKRGRFLARGAGRENKFANNKEISVIQSRAAPCLADRIYLYLHRRIETYPRIDLLLYTRSFNAVHMC